MYGSYSYGTFTYASPIRILPSLDNDSVSPTYSIPDEINKTHNVRISTDISDNLSPNDRRRRKIRK